MVLFFFKISQTKQPKWLGWGCAHAVPGQCSAVGITALRPWDYARSRHSMHTLAISGLV
jgi:hypothetical protein